MMTHWTIKVLNAVFVWSLGATVIWLLCRALITGWTEKKAQGKDTPLLLNIFKDGVPYLKMPFEKKRYTIGRDTGCDIPIRGSGIPAVIGEFCLIDGNCIFCSGVKDQKSTDSRMRYERSVIKPGYELFLYNYVLRIETI
ncbi:MAG: hypothetical protein BWK74_05300 [Desulfobacteraceae bacterium A6]|nr:MAG: hypothetical protein BWK74_05300 [Desulfobacteraceae bacterium A6]